MTGKRVIFFAKPIRRPDHSLLGIAVVGVRTDYFLQTFGVISGWAERSLNLLRRDGTVLLRFPDVDAIRTIPRMPAGTEWFDVVARGGGPYWSPGYFTGRSRWVSVSVIKRYPLVINVSSDEDGVLATWRSRVIGFGAGSLIILLVFAYLLRTLYQQFRKTHRSQRALARQSEQLSLANFRFNTALDHMSHALSLFDADERLQIHNARCAKLWGMKDADFRQGMSLKELLELRESLGIYKAGQAAEIYAYHLRMRDQRYSSVQKLCDGRSILQTFSPLPAGGWVSTTEDITEREKSAERISHMAHHDGLTELANRSLFVNALERLIAQGNDNFAVMLVDLDRFKEVNDTFGHGIGDKLLQIVSRRLMSAVRGGDLVARLGGDEFAILQKLEHGHWYRAEALVRRLMESVKKPYMIDGCEVTIGLSVGITFGSGETEVDQIMCHADLALYRAKGDGRNCFRLYDPAMEETVKSRRRLAFDLQHALNVDELGLVYQPIVDAQSLEIRSMEALLRWQHPTRGMVPPPEFIALAEEAGMIHRLGEWVLRRSCLEAMRWPDRIRVAVNVSALQVVQGTLGEMVERVLSETGFPAHRLKLEITESVLLSNRDHSLATLHALRDKGIGIALDDFGTGYSSLSYLKLFPFDEIKIDKSFVDDMQEHSGCAAIISATTTLARAFNIATTAEGVETKEQFDLLRAASVTQMQGYLFGKPAPAASFDFAEKLVSLKSA
jgi:diguanylate cyclase (GGDEF)-like protein